MSAKKSITLTIDGTTCAATEGQTILEVARAHGVYIPTLCYLKELTPWGGCRMCIVELAGSPKIVLACTTPVTPNSNVITNSPRLENLRKATLELLFSERNHICPICPSNKGDCGLQHQGYVHGVTGVRYPYLYPAQPVDLTAKYFGMDHNRCILCTRCVRTCDELEGPHTLDVGNRGIRNRVIVDMNITFGKSTTCTSCGACVANCPTGALFDKASAFRGSLASCEQVKTTCTECPVGCGLRVYTKENRIVNVWGDPDSPVSKGHLCVKGRYETWAESRKRITQPLLRGEDGKLHPATWDAAAQFIKDSMTKLPGWQTGLLVSPRVTNETVETIKKIAGKFDRIAAFVTHNESAQCGQPEFTAGALDKINDADLIIVVGSRPASDNGYVASRIRLAVRKRGAKLMIFHARKSSLDDYANICANVVGMERSFWKKVTGAIAGAKRPVLVYGPEAMTSIGVTVIDKITKAFEDNPTVPGPSVVSLPRTNGLSLAAGMELLDDVAPWLDTKPLSFLHIVASDEPDGGARLLHEPHVQTLLQHLDRVVVQAAYESPLTNLAALVLPAAIWAEKSGTITNFEGTVLPVRPVFSTAGEAREDKAILENLFA
jgi:formate dehydrogenase major subunit